MSALIVCVSMQGRLPKDAWPLSDCMAASVRRHIPEAYLVHDTDNSYPAMPWADLVRRNEVPGDLIDRRWTQMADNAKVWPDSCFLQLDCDIVVRSDVSDVFSQDFDIAMCRTPDRSDRVYNAGVIFQKPTGAAFWAEVVREYQDERIRDGWEGSQTALTRAADRMRKDGFKVLDLPFDVYNYTPDGPGMVPETARIVHYRGRRKRFMLKDNQFKEAA